MTIYHIDAGATGNDLTQPDANGNLRQMSYGERALRITGGVSGARQTIGTKINMPNSLTNRAMNKLDDVFKNNPPTIQRKPSLVTPKILVF